MPQATCFLSQDTVAYGSQLNDAFHLDVPFLFGNTA